MSDFDGEYMQKLSRPLVDIDKMFTFTYYMPHHNVQVVLQYLDKIMAIKRIKKNNVVR
jgi:hypothetical protein